MKIRDFYNEWLVVKGQKVSEVVEFLKKQADSNFGVHLDNNDICRIRLLVYKLQTKWSKCLRKKSVFESTYQCWLDTVFFSSGPALCLVCYHLIFVMIFVINSFSY